MRKFILFYLLLHSIIIYAQQANAPFIHGIASGDPLADRVILWTKLSPADTNISHSVNWRIATDTGFTQIINSGTVTTDSTSDFTVKTDATGLQPDTWYYYDFETGGNYSARGRTKTLPTGTVNHLRFAVATCAKFSKGYFNAYGRISEQNDIDAVIHLGDYIYESNQSNDDIRPMEPNLRCSTLNHFRTRYKQYHTDPDLVKARSLFPWINVWDDHETGNDCWMYGSEHFPDSASYEPVKQAATKTYFEWMPIRQDTANPTRIYRDFSFGNLADLIMLDTRREGREIQLTFLDSNLATIYDTNRTILGHQQYNWLTSKLSASTAKWRVLGQQVMMAPALFFNNPLNEDQWDGYPSERNKLYNHILSNNISNLIVLTGDIHASFANDLPMDVGQYNVANGSGSVGVEFITPAICSSESPFGNFTLSLVQIHDPHIQYADFTQNGYMILDITPQKVQGDYYYVSTDAANDTMQTLGASMYTLDGTRYLYRDTTNSSVPSVLLSESISVYPNPAARTITIKSSISVSEKINIEMIDGDGKRLAKMDTAILPGEQQVSLDISALSKGVYLLHVYSGTKEMKLLRFVISE